ncbi:hypothetical protein [Alicyclobacillus dauci]|uniref:Uncharacterized protein n=1 Tax=Alicyclobacillus dauci TaxID=1475485 RepID=A0ABY6YYX7_9BACL|nr:hypothetical protein [Alicyclobacillus dauci]WAH35647.1 hypothetical protein NZD86_15370 [Alicyclobacillus dauci]
MLIYKMATMMRQLQSQGLSQQEAATKLGIRTQLGGLGMTLRPKAVKTK